MVIYFYNCSFKIGGNSTGINGTETWVKFTAGGTLTLTALTNNQANFLAFF